MIFRSVDECESNIVGRMGHKSGEVLLFRLFQNKLKNSSTVKCLRVGDVDLSVTDVQNLCLGG